MHPPGKTVPNQREDSDLESAAGQSQYEAYEIGLAAGAGLTKNDFQVRPGGFESHR